jgi:hypothetical protein
LYRFEALRDGAVVASDIQLVQPGSSSELHLRPPSSGSALLQAKAVVRAGPSLVSTAPRSLSDAELAETHASLSQEQLSDTIKSHLDSLQRCYEVALQGSETPSEPATMDLELAIAAHGDVTSVRTQGSTLPGLDACFERNARTWVFPQAGRATQLRFPLVFRPVANTQLSSAQLTAVVARGKSMLQRCFGGSERDRVLKFDVDMEVLPSGAVSSVRIEGEVPDVDSCIARTVRMWQFPAALEATRTRFPVLLLPGA